MLCLGIGAGSDTSVSVCVCVCVCVSALMRALHVTGCVYVGGEHSGWGMVPAGSNAVQGDPCWGRGAKQAAE